jgi:hypothetical protein
MPRHSLTLLIDDWRPYEAARIAGVEVVNTLAYLVQLYARERMTVGHVLSNMGRLARRGTVRPEWIQSALKIVVEMRSREQNHEQGQTP